MTSPERRAPIRRLTPAALLAAAFLMPVPAPAQEPDCAVTNLTDWVSNSTQREVADENFACLQRRIEALEQERELLAQKLAAIESREELSSTVYLNRDGRVSRDERHLGPATFVLTGDRRGQPRSLALDHDRVLEMCADAEGCLVSLGLRGIVTGGEPVEAMFSGGACAFHLDERRNAWALSGHCAGSALPPAEAGAADNAPDGPRWGRDGDARPFSGVTEDGRVILSLGGACLLAEAPPETGPGSRAEPRLARDADPGLALVAAGAGWAPAGAFPVELLPLGLSDPDFQCSLTIRD